MQLIRIKKPSLVRKKVRRFSRSWIRCFRVLPFILLFITLLAFSFYSVSQISPDKMAMYGDNQFKLDPLIERNASTPEVWAQKFINLVYSAHIANLILQESDIKCLKQVTSSNNRNYSHSCSYNKLKTELSECPTVPNTLIGRINVSSDPLNITEEDVLQLVNPLLLGGGWQPVNCLAKDLVGIIIPYRDRKSHLLQLLYYLHPMLKRQQLNYRIFVVEQAGNSTFNKGAIMNAAFHIILKNKLLMGPLAFMCFIFHDVDMLPEDDRNMYSCSDYPRHLSVSVNEFGYKLPYYELVGGVFSIKIDHFLLVNGYSNLYWGWGGEDDDMGYRLSQVGLPISRPPASLARYTMVKHVKRRPLAYKVRSKLVRTSKRRYRLDGLNTLKYHLINISSYYLYTNILVDVGHPPKSIQDFQREYEKSQNITRH
ncbi:beta-1,4-galactosyltransferase 4-like isoform X3 [Planococcus citri]|uniref:beta-1,4-galactosyltransferase 4-like isoform X3 n=1 Tax=Planococcus citri TaxID=170843 RepID=UPI0031F9D2E2